jgi:hypothetical protein
MTGCIQQINLPFRLCNDTSQPQADGYSRSGQTAFDGRKQVVGCLRQQACICAARHEGEAFVQQLGRKGRIKHKRSDGNTLRNQLLCRRFNQRPDLSVHWFADLADVCCDVARSEENAMDAVHICNGFCLLDRVAGLQLQENCRFILNPFHIIRDTPEFRRPRRT